MRALPPVTYLTPAEIDARVLLREAEAGLLPVGKKKKVLLAEIERWRSYARMKRLLALPSSLSINVTAQQHFAVSPRRRGQS